MTQVNIRVLSEDRDAAQELAQRVIRGLGGYTDVGRIARRNRAQGRKGDTLIYVTVDLKGGDIWGVCPDCRVPCEEAGEGQALCPECGQAMALEYTGVEYL